MTFPLKQVLDANPDLRSGHLPQPMPGSAVTLMPSMRAQQPGGELMAYVQSQEIQYFEQLYRKLPPDGMYAATPNKPETFTMGVFKVPESMVLVIVDFAFDIYRFSGAAASDFFPIENKRLSTQVGWDITVNNTRPGQQLSFQLIPAVQTQSQQAFAQKNLLAPAQPWQFDQIRASQSQGPAGPALSMMPQRHHRDGQVKVSSNYVARSSSELIVTCSIINEIPIPVAFFEANIMGMLMPQNTWDAYQLAAAPTGTPQIPKLPGSP